MTRDDNPRHAAALASLYAALGPHTPITRPAAAAVVADPHSRRLVLTVRA
jgi:hypothetical protein